MNRIEWISNKIDRLNEQVYEIISPQNLFNFVIYAELFKSLYTLGMGSYAEVDFMCYMEQVERLLEGERDYAKIWSRNGPVAYPAISTYISVFMYYLSFAGKYVRPVQILAIIVYMVCVWMTVRVCQLAFKNAPKRANISVLLCVMFYCI